jgi:hypothetical protein
MRSATLHSQPDPFQELHSSPHSPLVPSRGTADERASQPPPPPPPPRPPLLGCMAAPAHPWHLQVHPLANVEVQDVPKVRVSHEHHKGVINTPVVTNGKTCTAQTGGGGRATHRHVSQSHPCRHARQLLACWYARSCLHVDMCAMTTDSTLTRMKTAAL